MRPRRSEHDRQGRYVLGELLGRGGMAEVFAGTVMGSHGFQKPVAIKRLLPELANDHVFVERLIGEAKLLVGMQHGNIVSVLDLAREGEDVFLVMEYVDGPSLRQLLKARGTRGLSLGTASYIVQSAAAGLEFAHARPGGAVIHADVSPSNLLLTTSGEVRVADFGIARRENSGAGIIEGKWAYMAPEQVRGEPLTPSSDVFALGIVLYELITGRHPLGHQINSPEERDGGPLRVIPPRVVNPNVPVGLDVICMRALADDPRDRFARMQHLIDAIVDERFTNQWRDGASELAQAIREITPGAPGAASAGPRTQVTGRPLTIVTRSLISAAPRSSRPSIDLGPATEPPRAARAPESIEATAMLEVTGARGSAPALPPSGAQTCLLDLSVSVAPSGAQTRLLDISAVPAAPAEHDEPTLDEPTFDLQPSGARTRMISASPLPLPASPSPLSVLVSPSPAPRASTPAMVPGRAGALPLPALLQMPAAAIPAVLPAGAFRVSAAMLPPPELASVHGGATSAAPIDVRAPRHTWTFAVLGVAAILGVIAAVQLAPAESPRAEAAEQTRRAVAPQPREVPDHEEPVAQVVTATSSDRASAPAPTLPTVTTVPTVPTVPTMTETSGTDEPALEAEDLERDVPVVDTRLTTAGDRTSRRSEPRSVASKGKARPAPRERRLATGEEATLRVTTYGAVWADVYVGNQEQEVPNAKFKLAPGTYTVMLRNSDLGVRRSCKVTLAAGQVRTLKVDMEQGGCQVDP